MMHIMQGDQTVAELQSNPSLATWLLAHPETHDYVEGNNGVKRLEFREPWRLIKWPTVET